MPPPSLGDLDLVLHAAAWTDVDGAGGRSQSAAAVNVGGTQHARELGAPLVYFSTDYVFDGTKRTPYVESRCPEPPVGVRAHEAERRGRLPGKTPGSSAPPGLRLDGHNCPYARCSGLVQSADEVAVVAISADRQPSRASSPRVPEARRASRGLWHLAADGDCTWADFARRSSPAAASPFSFVRPYTDWGLGASDSTYGVRFVPSKT